MPRLAELAGYAYYFQFTVTPYGPDIEPGVPDKEKEIIPAFRRLAETIGPERVIWRCDPLLVGERYDVDFHLRSFEKFARAFEAFTRRCVFSYLDIYRGMSRAAKELGFRAPDEREKLALARELAPVARAHGMTLESCAEDINLEQFGILHTSCIDAALIEKITGRPVLARQKTKTSARTAAARRAIRHRRLRHLPERLQILLRDAQRKENRGERQRTTTAARRICKHSARIFAERDLLHYNSGRTMKVTASGKDGSAGRRVHEEKGPRHNTYRKRRQT